MKQQGGKGTKDEKAGKGREGVLLHFQVQVNEDKAGFLLSNKERSTWSLYLGQENLQSEKEGSKLETPWSVFLWAVKGFELPEASCKAGWGPHAPHGPG